MLEIEDPNVCWSKVEIIREQVANEVNACRCALQNNGTMNRWQQIRDGNARSLAQINRQLGSLNQQEREVFEFMLDIELTPILAAYAIAIADWVEERRARAA